MLVKSKHVFELEKIQAQYLGNNFPAELIQKIEKKNKVRVNYVGNGIYEKVTNAWNFEKFYRYPIIPGAKQNVFLEIWNREITKYT